MLSTDRGPEFQVQVYIILDAVKLLCRKVITLNYWGLEEAYSWSTTWKVEGYFPRHQSRSGFHLVQYSIHWVLQHVEEPQ
jgi:hypothetical protein